MKMVIDISKHIYDCVIGKTVLLSHIDGMCKAIEEGTPFIERPKGKWISHREHCENLGVMPSGLGAYEWCSNCDCGIDVREWHRNHYNFCPNCGAEMEDIDETNN